MAVAESIRKKPKYSWDNKLDYPKHLAEICKWTNPDCIAIEYHDTLEIQRIKYVELINAQLLVSNILKRVIGSEFIGINFDVHAHLVPALMLGILHRNMVFVSLSSEMTVRTQLIKQLHINYVFVQELILGTTIVCQFELHGKQIYLVKLSDPAQSTEKTIPTLYAYAISTSGSTGIPKIVKVPHSCIIPNILDLQRILEVTEAEKIAQMTNFTFDPSIVEVFLSLVAGSTLFVPSKALKNDPRRLLQIIFENEVTILQITPSLLLHRWTYEDLKRTILGKDSSLKTILLGGEPMLGIKAMSQIRHNDNVTKIFNIYGITEVSCWSSIANIRLHDEQIDFSYLGVPLSEIIFQVRDDKGKVINDGEGFLYIGSNTRICSIDNEKMENLEGIVFRDSGDIVTVNHKNEVFYKGRRNRVIKRYGHRLNLQELDTTVQELNFVQNSYAFWDEKCYTLHLCLHVTHDVIQSLLIERNVFKYLEKLPPIYKPDKIHCLSHFKLTDNGKISVSFIENICVENKTGNEEVLTTTLWQRAQDEFENMWHGQLGSTSNGFVKLGGTSVLALQISSAITETLRIEFPELIGLLLKDATFQNCLTYIKTVIYNLKCNAIFGNTSTYDDSNTINRNVNKNFLAENRPTHSDDQKHLNVQNHFKNKCKGKIGGCVSKQHNVRSASRMISKITVQASYNLRKCVDASPTVFEYADGKSFVTVGSHSGVICTVELSDDAAVYETKLPDRIEASCLVLTDFRAIVGCYDGCIYCVNLRTGTIIWKYQTGDIVKCTAIICKEQNNIFVGSYDHHVYCIVIQDGSGVWKNDVNHGSIQATGCLHHQTHSVLFGTLDGSCVALDQLSGKIIWKNTLTHPIFVAPVTLCNGLALFCSVAGSVACYDIVNDEKIWTYAINGNIFSYPLVHFDPVAECECILIGSKNQKLYCLEIRNSTSQAQPTLKFTLDCGKPIFATPWCENGLIFVACTDGTCLIYSFPKGELITNIKLPGDIFSSPVIHSEWACVGCRDDHLYILNLRQRI